MLRERVHEPEGAGHGLAPHRLLLRARRLLLVLAMRVDRRVARRGRLLVLGIVVGGALVLPGRLAEVLVLEQQIGEPIVDRRRFQVFGEGGEIRAVPVQCFLEVRGLLVRQLLLLVERVVVIRQVLQVGSSGS